jgi:hypothetical protein
VSSLRILRVNPLEHADELKRLFLADDTQDFPESFDRAYPSVVRTGGKSWIGVDSDGHVVAHIARFPRQFTLREHTLAAGLLVDVMVAKSHRTFLPALRLVRQMVANSNEDGDVDFLYAAPNTSANALLKAARFSTVGTLDRFVLPLAGRRWYEDAIVQVYRSMARIVTRGRAAQMIEHTAQGFDAGVFERPAGQAPVLRPFRPPELYRQRLVDYPSPDDYWFTFHWADEVSHPCAAVLVRGRPDRVAVLVSLSREPSVRLSAIIPALATALRRHGYARLWVIALSQSPLARELTRAGFFQRHDGRALVAFALTEFGSKALQSAAAWEITEFDCDR